MGLILNEVAKSELAGAITANATSIPIKTNDYLRFLSSTTAGEYYYLTIRTTSNYEYVKVDVANSSVANGLAVTRAQGGSSARAWKAGTLIYASLIAEVLENYQQKGYRTYAGDPSGNVTPLRIGEKILDSTNGAWFKSVGTTVNDWGGMTWKSYAWEEHFDFEANDGWTELNGGDDMWDEVNNEWFPIADGSVPAPYTKWVYLKPHGGWEVGFTGEQIRMTWTGPTHLYVRMINTDDEDMYSSENWLHKLYDPVEYDSAEDIKALMVYGGDDDTWRITNI